MIFQAGPEKLWRGCGVGARFNSLSEIVKSGVKVGDLMENRATNAQGRREKAVLKCEYPGCGQSFEVASWRKGRRKWCSTHGKDRRVDAAEPFSPDQVAHILEEARAMPVHLNPTSRIEAGSNRPGSGVIDAEFMERVVLTLLYTGIHISALPRLNSQANITYLPVAGSEVMHVGWRRPKNERMIAMFPVSKHLQPWLPAFLDQPKPGSRVRYYQLMRDMEDRMVTRGVHIHMNNLRFRHTCAVNLRHEFGLSDEDLMRYLGVSRETLAHYVHRPAWMASRDLMDKGW